MALVFGGEEDWGADVGPLDAEGGVVEAQAALGLRIVEVIALVGKERVVFEYDEPVREAARDVELTSVLGGKDFRDILAVGRRALPDVDRHVPDRAVDHVHQLRLRTRRRLPVESAHHALRGERLVVLHEVGGNSRLLVALGVIGFAEPSAGIAEAVRLDDLHIRNRSLNNFHNQHILYQFSTQLGRGKVRECVVGRCRGSEGVVEKEGGGGGRRSWSKELDVESGGKLPFLVCRATREAAP